MSDKTRAEKYLDWLKNNKTIAVVIVFSITVIGISTFLAATMHIISLIPKAQRVANYDSKTQEELFRIAEMIDNYHYLAKRDSIGTADLLTRHDEIAVSLRSVLLRNKVRPLNTASVKIIEIIIKLWTKEFEPILKKKIPNSTVGLKVSQDLFQNILEYSIKFEILKKDEKEYEKFVDAEVEKAVKMTIDALPLF